MAPSHTTSFPDTSPFPQLEPQPQHLSSAWAVTVTKPLTISLRRKLGFREAVA